jgi:hypothetical protein
MQKMQDAEDTGCKMQKIQDARCRRYRMQDAEDTGCKIQDSGFKTRSFVSLLGEFSV